MSSNTLTITVSKARLLDMLQKNMSDHATTYEKAKRGYLRVTRERLDNLLRRVVEGELLDRVWLDAPPEDHTGDYEDVIAMMEWSTDDTIELTQAQFKQYIQDDWGWREQWMTSNSAYLNA